MFKAFLRKLHWLLASQFGIDPRISFRSLRGLPRYIHDYFSFRSTYAGCMELKPCLHDRHEEGGATNSEYFWQDLLVARKIFEINPEKHVDIGSRVDGFVAHVASFREIEVFDVRAVTTHVPGIVFKQSDLMNPLEGMANYCDSVSCLHALEHFGLGRYGDPIDPTGFVRGIKNIANLLKENGIFYLSVPVGTDRVEFNANRVFDPRIIINHSRRCSLELMSLQIIWPNYDIEEIMINDENLSKLAAYRYCLGIFTFKKLC